MQQESIKLNNYNDLIYNSQIALQKINYTPSIKSNDENEDENIYKYSSRIIDYNKMNSSLENIGLEYKILDDHMLSKVDMKFSMEISVLVITTLLTICGLICKKIINFFNIKILAIKYRKKGLLISISLTMFLLLIPMLVIQGYGYSFFNASIDMCNDVKNIIDKNLEPKLGSGIGYFVTCPAKQIRKNIYSSKFILSKSYDILYDELNEKVLPVMDQGLARRKRNNTYLNSLKTHFKQNETLSKGFETLTYFNDMLFGLESLGVCEYARSCVNFIEENFCYRNLQAQQDAFIYYTLGSLGVLIVSIALNKISVYTREKVKIFNNFL